jgi:hypothetical protein
MDSVFYKHELGMAVRVRRQPGRSDQVLLAWTVGVLRKRREREARTLFNIPGGSAAVVCWSAFDISDEFRGVSFAALKKLQHKA